MKYVVASCCPVPYSSALAWFLLFRFADQFMLPCAVQDRYLENVFRGSEDIRPHLPDESIMFDDVNEGFINMMRPIWLLLSHTPLWTVV